MASQGEGRWDEGVPVDSPCGSDSTYERDEVVIYPLVDLNEREIVGQQLLE